MDQLNDRKQINALKEKRNKAKGIKKETLKTQIAKLESEYLEKYGDQN